MKRIIAATLFAMLALTLLVGAESRQTILKAFAPANSDGTTVALAIDWAQVKTAAPEVTFASVRRRPAGPPVRMETIGILPLDQGRYVDTALDAGSAYHYYLYFKDADSTTLKFGSFPAVVHLGPLHTTAGH